MAFCLATTSVMSVEQREDANPEKDPHKHVFKLPAPKPSLLGKLLYVPVLPSQKVRNNAYAKSRAEANLYEELQI